MAYLIWLPLDKISKRETEAALPETTVDVESLALKPVVLIIQRTCLEETLSINPLINQQT